MIFISPRWRCGNWYGFKSARVESEPKNSHESTSEKWTVSIIIRAVRLILNSNHNLYIIIRFSLSSLSQQSWALFVAFFSFFILSLMFPAKQVNFKTIIMLFEISYETRRVMIQSWTKQTRFTWLVCETEATGIGY